MKKLALIVLLAFGFMHFVSAQTASNEPTAEDYERLIRNYEKIEFRKFAIETLELTPEQIEAFDPIYRQYMSAKNNMAQRKFRLLEEFSEEMAEDDSPENEEDDKGDFIENYWEIEIDEMELRKDYFDRLEDKITADNAFAFFVLEDIVQNGIKKRIVEKRYVPVFVEVEKIDSSSTSSTAKNSDQKKANTVTNKSVYKANVDAFNNWMNNTGQKVGLGHNYTHDGLNALVGAIKSIYKVSDLNIEKFDVAKALVVDCADKLQDDRLSDKHADWARQAFLNVAEMLESMQAKGNFMQSKNAVAEVRSAAEKIDPNKLMTPQAKHIYDFFEKAQVAVNSMSERVSWAAND